MLLFLDTLFFNICIYISVLRKKASGKRKNNIVKELFSHNRYTHSSLGPDSARTLRQSSLYTSFPASSGISGTACARHCLYSILSKIGHCCCYEHYFFFFLWSSDFTGQGTHKHLLLLLPSLSTSHLGAVLVNLFLCFIK